MKATIIVVEATPKDIAELIKNLDIEVTITGNNVQLANQSEEEERPKPVNLLGDEEEDEEQIDLMNDEEEEEEDIDLLDDEEV